jgi:hypothetical protein
MHELKFHEQELWGGPKPKEPKPPTYEELAIARKRERERLHEGRVDDLLTGPGGAQQYMTYGQRLAQAQMRQGVGEAGRQMAGQAVSRGSSPLAQRAAIYGGGQMGLQAANMSTQTGAAMSAQAAQLKQQMELGQIQGTLGAQGMALEERRRRDAWKLGKEQLERGGTGDGGAGMAMQGAGIGMAALAGLAAFSDVSAKTDVSPLGSYGEYKTDTANMLGQSRENTLRGQEQAMEWRRLRDDMAKDDAADTKAKTQGVAGVVGQIGQGLIGMGGQRQPPPASGFVDNVTRYSSDRGDKEKAFRMGAEAAIRHYNDKWDYGAEGSQKRGYERFDESERYSPKDSQYSPLDDAMRSTPAYSYRYKPEVAARIGQDQDTRAGIMAQDAERHPLTAAMVRDTPQGKTIDMPTAVSYNLAAVNRLAERLDAQDEELRYLRGTRHGRERELREQGTYGMDADAMREPGGSSLYDMMGRQVSDGSDEQSDRTVGHGNLYDKQGRLVVSDTVRTPQLKPLQDTFGSAGQREDPSLGEFRHRAFGGTLESDKESKNTIKVLSKKLAMYEGTMDRQRSGRRRIAEAIGAQAPIAFGRMGGAGHSAGLDAARAARQLKEQPRHEGAYQPHPVRPPPPPPVKNKPRGATMGSAYREGPTGTDPRITPSQGPYGMQREGEQRPNYQELDRLFGEEYMKGRVFRQGEMRPESYGPLPEDYWRGEGTYL